jgi:hypothetical protein
MPWMLIWHNDNNKAGMKARTKALMEKFNAHTIPALVLLDEGGGGGTSPRTQQGGQVG